MFSWSVRRRLIYIAIALVLLVGAVVAVFVVFKPGISCTDGKENGDEVGVDCGGSCSKVCSSEILPLRLIWSRLFTISDGNYDAVALVKNPNVKHGATVAKYIFKAWDNRGLLISVTHGTALLNPKEDLVIFDSRINVGKRVPLRVTFEWDGSPAWEKIEKQVPSITFSDKQFSNEPTPRLTAMIKNDSLVEVKNIQVLTILSDDKQNAVAVSSTFVESLPGGESQEVAFTWPKSFVGAVSFVDLSAHYDWRQLP